MKLRQVSKSSLDVWPINWTGLPARYMNPGELETLVALIRSATPSIVIEFGCNTGRTALAVLREVPRIEKYVGIDVLPGYVPEKPVQRNEVPQIAGEMVLGNPKFELILRARGSHDLWIDDLPQCDAVFIDGDHSRTGVEHDTAIATNIVRPGGIIVWHDYHDLGTVDVSDVLEGMASRGDDIQHVTDTWLAFRRM